MDIKKRKADLQLLPEIANNGEAEEVSQQTKKAKEDSIPTNIEFSTSAPSSTTAATGFLAYSKVNPFAAAIANSSNSIKSFGTFGSKFSSSSAEKTGVNQLQPSSSAPPSVIPSPKSPKFNPFSSPSPAHNPFMTIVDGKDDWWSKMASSKSDTESAGGFFSKDEVEKSKQISDGCEKDSPVGGDDDDRPDDDNTGNQVYTKIYPMPENVVVLTGEENDECLLVTRAKMYRLDIDPRNVSGSSQTNGEAEKEVDASSHDKSSEGLEEKVILDELKSDNHEKEKDVAQGKTSNPEWIEVGVGPLKLLKTNSTGGSSFVRLVMRREDKKGGIGTKLILNVRVNQYVSVHKHGDKMIRLICVNAATEDTKSLHTYLLKTKTPQESEDILTLLKNTIDASKSSATSTG